ncbi:PadR family transcriptional regulator [Streptomyces sp. NBC_01356]|uniref:PadR family transcriptional regulator n=1 Tax=Streptomyces sp. NBC_01356 TaxID=2903836 RepID=UPI002E336817|nr:PadR family transcriptional regulator [Streptomyces sp. NBC_01356]
MRKTGPLALAVLATLAPCPAHPYELARALRARGQEQSIKIRHGSLYSTVRALARDGLIEVAGIERDGRRPPRTVYRITASGRADLRGRLAELLRTPEPEYPQFTAGLSLINMLPLDEARGLFEERLTYLDRAATAMRDASAWGGVGVPGRLSVAQRYAKAMAAAEAAWTRRLVQDLADGSLTRMDRP